MIKDPAPLSFNQERLWFFDQLNPGSPVYNKSVVYRVTGQLNVMALEQSLSEIVRRHEAIRTTFAALDGQPVQVISPEVSLTMLLVDLQEVPTEQRSAELQRLIREETLTPIDLAQGPLLRVHLLRLSEHEHVLLLTTHQIVFDSSSVGVFMQELAALYEAFCTSKPSPLPELPIQYADFAIGQRRHWLQSEVLESHLDYWKQQLGGSLSLVELPTDYPRPLVQTYPVARQPLELPKELTSALLALSQREGVTLFMTLLAAFKTLLYRYTEQEDIIVGSVIANRNQAEIKGLIGVFDNTLVLGTDIGGNPSFRQLLGRVREVVSGAYAHQDLPFEKLVEELQPKRDLSRSPLFQVMFNLQDAPMPVLELSSLTLTPLEVHNLTAFDLTLSLVNTEQRLIGFFEYNTDLFDATTITRMSGHFQTLLIGVAANPDRCLCDLPLLTKAERHQLLVEWNDTQTNYPKNACIHQLFEAQVEKTPDAVALVFEDQQLTYRELNASANCLASHLRSLGVGPSALVGICLERSLEMVVGLLGILKAGGAYLPLDSAYPKERLAFMLEDAQVSVLLTQQPLVKKLPPHQAQIVCLDTDWEIINRENQQNKGSDVTADNLAYVMYTSGSTGRPKGVSVIHRGVVRLVKETNYVNLTTAEVFLQFAPISFDASTFEIWGCLLNGARLVICPAYKPSLEELGQIIQRYQITTLWLTAGLFHLMVDERLEALKPLSQLLAGGDVLSVPHVHSFLQHTDCKLINGYGPTENTTFTCCYPITKLTPLGISIPIGRPIANTQVYLLDKHLQPVPVGVPGELYIGGDGLAQSYLNRPDLTTEKFVANPFSNEPGARLYKTGDLARYLSDGNIQFLGRIDNQVKIRGFRIELGEIERVLGKHPNIREVVVLVREDEPGQRRIVAYIVANQKSTYAQSEYISFLQEQLPEFMMPSAFVMLEALPLTPNGKVDRRALPAPSSQRPQLEQPYVAPQSELERLLESVWSKLLKIDRPGIHDNFFDLGGNSILSLQVVVQVQQELGIDLPVVKLFQHPTISGLANYLSPNQGSQKSYDKVQSRAQRQKAAHARRQSPPRR